MRLSRRSEYGLRALIDLGIAQQTGRPQLRIAEIARHEGLPIKFLEQILVRLRDAGLLSARRGPGGGYSLARPMADIRMGDALRHLSGSLALLECVEVDEGRSCTCPDRGHCGLRLLMDDVHRATADVLDRFTLADLVRITVRKLRKDRSPLPFPPLDGVPHAARDAAPAARRPVRPRLRG